MIADTHKMHDYFNKLTRNAPRSALWLVMLLSLFGCDNHLKVEQIAGSTMGTTYSIKYLAEDNTPSKAQLQQHIDALLAELNQQMSTYKKDSELSLFNQSRELTPFVVSPETALVITEALRLNQVTQGALDITVGPLVNLWGFGPQAHPDKVPTPEQLALAKQRIGIDALRVENNQVIKSKPDLYVDLSTLAKGWGVDVIANYLQSQQIENYMVEIGGELRLKGVNPQSQPWRIAIEKPDVGEREIQLIVQPGEMAMATSGDYRNYFEQDGIRYSHIIDPTTGHPIHHKVVSVTVLHPSAMTADGLATGLMVLGSEKGIEIANQHDIAVYMVLKTEDGFEQVYSEAFAPYLSKENK